MNLSTKTQNIVTELRDRLKAVYGERLYRFVLFGSHARGEARPDSDIDVLVVLTGDVNPGQEIVRVSNLLADLSLEHDTVINCLFMDATHFNTRQGPLLRNIRREGIAV